MRLRIPVKDRISTYPGRVTLTPVPGAENTFDMERADSPLEEGTPVNKVLFDSKADVVTEDMTVYVSVSGNDAVGDGTADSPFATIQKAVDMIPKVLDGRTVTIDIASGTYNERVSVVGFSGGTLIVGVSGRNVTIRGIEIVASSLVETNIANVIADGSSGGTLYLAKNGSNVRIGSGMTVLGNDATSIGIYAVDSSSIIANVGTTVYVGYCYGVAASASLGSFVSFDTLSGEENVVGVTAVRGSIVSYNVQNMTNMWGNSASSGGLVLTGSNSSELSGATLDL